MDIMLGHLESENEVNSLIIRIYGLIHTIPELDKLIVCYHTDYIRDQRILRCEHFIIHGKSISTFTDCPQYYINMRNVKERVDSLRSEIKKLEKELVELRELLGDREWVL